MPGHSLRSGLWGFSGVATKVLGILHSIYRLHSMPPVTRPSRRKTKFCFYVRISTYCIFSRDGPLVLKRRTFCFFRRSCDWAYADASRAFYADRMGMLRYVRTPDPTTLKLVDPEQTVCADLPITHHCRVHQCLRTTSPVAG